VASLARIENVQGVKKRADLLTPGDRIVSEKDGVVTVLKNMDASDGERVLMVVKANGKKTLLKVAPWHEVPLHAE